MYIKFFKIYIIFADPIFSKAVVQSLKKQNNLLIIDDTCKLTIADDADANVMYFFDVEAEIYILCKSGRHKNLVLKLI